MVSHEINKRGSERGRREAPSIYNSILPSVHFSAVFLSLCPLLILSSFSINYHSFSFSSLTQRIFSPLAISVSISFSLSSPVLHPDSSLFSLSH